MGGASEENACVCSDQTVVLVGRTGNGKSATANSILGRMAFLSKASPAGVTSACKLAQTVLSNGKTINVIDTPGLFDPKIDLESVVREIANCLSLVKNGIHAILLVLSIKCRFSPEEKAAIQKLQELFGEEILNYMILVFTNGDALEDNRTIEDFLDDNCPEALEELIGFCDSRFVLFDNKIPCQVTKERQLTELFCLVDKVAVQNGGRPYTIDFMPELNEGDRENWLKQITEKVEERLRNSYAILEQKFQEERAARLKADEQIQDLKDDIKETRKKNEELRNLEDDMNQLRLKHDKLEKDMKEKEEEEARKKKEEKARKKKEEEEARKKKEEEAARHCNIL